MLFSRGLVQKAKRQARLILYPAKVPPPSFEFGLGAMEIEARREMSSKPSSLSPPLESEDFRPPVLDMHDFIPGNGYKINKNRVSPFAAVHLPPVSISPSE